MSLARRLHRPGSARLWLMLRLSSQFQAEQCSVRLPKQESLSPQKPYGSQYRYIEDQDALFEELGIVRASFHHMDQ